MFAGSRSIYAVFDRRYMFSDCAIVTQSTLFVDSIAVWCYGVRLGCHLTSSGTTVAPFSGFPSFWRVRDTGKCCSAAWGHKNIEILQSASQSKHGDVHVPLRKFFVRFFLCLCPIIFGRIIIFVVLLSKTIFFLFLMQGGYEHFPVTN